MRIEVIDTRLNYEVRLSAPRDEFGGLLGSFKDEIPRSCRRYNDGGQYWHVERRAVNALRGFVERMRAAGATVIDRSVPRAVVTFEEMVDRVDGPETILRKARALGYLKCPAADESSLPDQHRMQCSAENRPMVQVIKHPRWCELRGLLFVGVLSGAAKSIIFRALVAGLLPGGSVRVAGNFVQADRFPFALGDEMALWLSVELRRESNIASEVHGCDLDRWEALKLVDGSTVIVEQPPASALVA